MEAELPDLIEVEAGASIPAPGTVMAKTVIVPSSAHVDIVAAINAIVDGTTKEIHGGGAGSTLTLSNDAKTVSYFGKILAIAESANSPRHIKKIEGIGTMEVKGNVKVDEITFPVYMPPFHTLPDDLTLGNGVSVYDVSLGSPTGKVSTVNVKPGAEIEEMNFSGVGDVFIHPGAKIGKLFKSGAGAKVNIFCTEADKPVVTADPAQVTIHIMPEKDLLATIATRDLAAKNAAPPPVPNVYKTPKYINWCNRTGNGPDNTRPPDGRPHR